MGKTLLILIALLAASAFLALAAGSAWIGPGRWLDGNEAAAAILGLRLRRAAAAFLVGGALAVAGAAYQAVLRNPLAEPYILGVSAGAGLGAAWALATGATAALALPGGAFAGALAALAAVLAIAGRGQALDPLRLLLAGVIVGTVCSGALMFVVSCLDAAMNQSLLWWMLGSLQAPEPAVLVVAAVAAPAGAACLWWLGEAADIMTLGGEMAHGMGVAPRRTMLALLLTGTLLAALAVALAGVIGFVGLLVPHCLRLLCGAGYRRLSVLAFLGGGIFLMNCDTLSRSVFAAREIPVGVVTAMVGGPLFIWMLVRRKI